MKYMTENLLDKLEASIVAELGNEFDVDMLSSTLSNMKVSDSEAFVCAGCFLGPDALDTFEYEGKSLKDLPQDEQDQIMADIINLSKD